MTKQAINLTTVVSGFDSGTNLDPVGVRQNNQGVTLAEANAFIAVDAAAPDAAKGVVGDFSFSTAANKLEICVGAPGFIYPDRTLSAASAVAGATAATYPGIVPTGGSGTGLVVTIVMSSATAITSSTVTTAGSGYVDGDVLTIPAAVVGATSTEFTLVAITAADLYADYRSVTLS